MTAGLRGAFRQVWLAMAGLAIGIATPAQAPRLGTIDFPTSGAAAAQPHFIRGVLLLHSFEYRDAAQAFRAAQQIDPGFALAYWGEALTYTHPIWKEQDVAAARAVLERLGATPQARRAKAPTPRERAYLSAVEALYGEGTKAGRDTAYSIAMRRVMTSFPADREAKVFYALSLLGLNQGVRDVATYLRAAALLEPVFRDNPDHPGAAHLLIHCYDDPIHASRGLAAARAYAKIAPDAPHAQHMTTHIFVALGMWDEVVSQNEIASGRDRSAWTPHHYTDWLGYGYLQQGRYTDAWRLLELMRPNADEATGRGLAVLAQMRADYLVNSERWDSPSLQWRFDLTHANSRAQAVDAFVTGFSALQRGDRAGAQPALADLAALTGARPAPGTGYVDPVPAIVELELRAAARQAEGAPGDAVTLMRRATALEDAMPLEFGPPGVVKPAHELQGEMLLRAGRPREAKVEFIRSLHLAPKRALSLLGLARAAAAAGDGKTAAEAYAELQRIWHRADPGVPGLAEAARFLAARP
jgi:tetratricopeptide (TPR) repeat protein